LEIRGDEPVRDLENLPKMPSLRVLRVDSLENTEALCKWATIGTLELLKGAFPGLLGVDKLEKLTHLRIGTSLPLNLSTLSALYGLRFIEIDAPKIEGLMALGRLPVLHEIHIGDGTLHSEAELGKLLGLLTPWRDEFRSPEERTSPSLEIKVVSEDAFERYDSKEPYGIIANECEDGMFESERKWLTDELRGALQTTLEDGDDSDFLFPGMDGFRRSERLVLYSLRAYGLLRLVVTAVQEVLCNTRNDWIVYLQGLASEGPDVERLPEEARDFEVWIYSDRMVATSENAAIIRQLIE
jgi:hypothetical protein